MDNQQERSIVSPEFLAGLIVGEGSYSLAIVRSRGKDHLEIRPIFSLRMNDLETIDAVCESFKFHGLSLYRNPNLYARCATVSTTGIKRMRAHLDFFLPLLTGKKKQAAQIVSDFCDRRLSEDHWANYTEVDVQAIEALRSINGPSAKRTSIEILRDYTRRTTPRGKRRPVKI